LRFGGNSPTKTNCHFLETLFGTSEASKKVRVLLRCQARAKRGDGEERWRVPCGQEGAEKKARRRRRLRGRWARGGDEATRRVRLLQQNRGAPFKIVFVGSRGRRRDWSATSSPASTSRCSPRPSSMSRRPSRTRARSPTLRVGRGSSTAERRRRSTVPRSQPVSLFDNLNVGTRARHTLNLFSPSLFPV
jgi:hypothetical protein